MGRGGEGHQDLSPAGRARPRRPSRTRAPRAGTARVRRPRLVFSYTPHHRSTIVAGAVAFALVAAGVRAAASTPDAGADAAPRTIADGVRRLRATVVGDVKDDPATAARRARPPAPVVAAAPASAGVPGERVQRRVSRRLAAALTPGVPWWADSAHWGAEVVRWTETTRAPLVVDAGDTIAVAPPELPAALPAVLRRRGVRWHVDGAAALAEVTGAGDGRVVGRAPGEAAVTALSAAGLTVTPVRVRAAVRGRVYTVGDDGALGVAAARVVVRRPGAVDTVVTDGAGRFRAPLPDGWDGVADVRVEPLAGGDAAGGHAALTLTDVPAARLHTLGVVLPPARWTIAAGQYAGAVVPVRAAWARGFWRAADTGRPVAWPGDGPRSVALDRVSGPGRGALVDTAAFWAAARALEQSWGRSLFRPAAPGETPEVTVRITPGLRAAGMTTLSYDGTGTVAAADVEFRSAAVAADPRVVAHELLHALGFGHARAWASVVGVAGSAGPAAPTPADVAHGHLFDAVRRAVRAAEQEYGAAFGWYDGRP